MENTFLFHLNKLNTKKTESKKNRFQILRQKPT